MLELIQALDANAFVGLISATGEVMQLKMAMLDGKIISIESLELMMTPEKCIRTKGRLILQGVRKSG
jgi:hypothetical protein